MIKLLTLKANDFKQLQNVDMRFPAQGSVLIEGRNEAGKSTLFEAIFFALFGKPLLPGTTAEDLIGYQANEALVLLEISVRDQRFLIQRKVKRTKTRSGTDARVRVFNADGTEGEEVRGASAVNQRLQQELKLDADAFLNSCFVEQKKLEKLEGLNAHDRETSLMRLLNMDRMLDEERSLRITVDDTRRLQRLEQRVKLAEVMAEIPGVQKAGRECKMALDIIAIKDTLAAIEACHTTIASAETRLAALVEPVKDLEQRIQRIDAVRTATASAEIIAVRIGAVEQQARDIARLTDQIGELERVAAEELPALRERLARTKRLRGRWSRLIALDAEARRASGEADALRRRIADVEAAALAVAEMEARVEAERERIEALEAEERELSVAERALGLRQALEDWQAATHAQRSLAELQSDIRRAEQASASADGDAAGGRERVEALSREVARCVPQAILGFLAAAILVGAGFALNRLALSVIALAPTTWAVLRLLQWRAKAAVAKAAAGELPELLAQARDTQNAFVRLEGQMENARATSGAAAGRLEQATIRLESLDEAIPSSPEDAARRLDALPTVGEIADTTRLGTLRRELAQAQGAMEEQQRAIESRHREVAAANVTVLKASADRLEAWSARVREAIVDPWAEAARDRSAALGIGAGEDMPANREGAASLEAGLVEQIRLKERGLTERTGIERRIAQTQGAGEREREEMLAAWPSIAGVRPDTAPPGTAEHAATLRADLAAELDALDEPSVRTNLRSRREERNAAVNDRTVAQREASAAESELRHRADGLKYPSDAPLTPEALEDALPGWGSAHPAQRTEREAEFDDLKDRNAGLIARRNDLASALDLDPAKGKLDVDTERAQRDDTARDLGIREKGIAILKAARERIMSKVLPYTIEHMRRILPALTMERYHDAKLTSDYKIEVWDERASMWKAKNIFSGGTRDQFSLALRLAFAVATLPQERGAAPGFIFLDEPLSSFDVERSSALMYLLTKGEIAETFDQILVISHSQAIAADDFQYRMRMDGGRIVEAGEELLGLPEQMVLATGEE